MIAIKVDDYIAAALAVIAGVYGNGDERREKLESEGYDYSKVQSTVNKLLEIMDGD